MPFRANLNNYESRWVVLCTFRSHLKERKSRRKSTNLIRDLNMVTIKHKLTIYDIWICWSTESSNEKNQPTIWYQIPRFCHLLSFNNMVWILTVYLFLRPLFNRKNLIFKPNYGTKTIIINFFFKALNCERERERERTVCKNKRHLIIILVQSKWFIFISFFTGWEYRKKVGKNSTFGL